MKWIGHAACMAEMKTPNILLRRLLGKRVHFTDLGEGDRSQLK
jgi:hypothetical protein